jgi:hypothetical protein
MRHIKRIFLAALLLAAASSCNKIIDLAPQSYIGADDYYHDYGDVQVALTGCYNGLQAPLQYEWMLTELRSDNAMQGVTGSSSTINLDFNQLDMYEPAATLPEIYDYWLAVYTNIRSVNYVLRSLGLQYANGSVTLGKATAKMTEEQRDELAGEALFLRAYHYFNLVRLFGGVFLLPGPVSPQEAQQVNRSSSADCYAMITADLKEAVGLLPRTAYQNIAPDNLGRATVWAAEALLAKVYLTTGQKADALPLLNDVIDHSGYGLQDNYADIFSTSDEMNKEILFAVRFKAGGVGLGNFMPNDFAPQGSGNAVVNGDGSGYDYPSDLLDSAFNAADQRYAVTIGVYQTKLYAKKFVVPVLVKDDAENDFPVLRFADVLLMKAEATGFDGPAGISVGLINEIRARAGAVSYAAGDFDAGFYQYPTDAASPYAITDAGKFMDALLHERRLEFAFENQRLFTLERTGQAVSALQDYFEGEYTVHYSEYSPQPTLQGLQSNVTSDRLLLPIPQREIDANTTITIAQNAGY